MPLLRTETLPPEVPIAMVDAVSAVMEVEANPPAGLIVHTHYEANGRVHILDLWETQADAEAFEKDRLLPAMTKVAADNGMALADAPPSETETAEVTRVIRGH